MFIPSFLSSYETPTRACFAVPDDFGNLIPCNRVTYWVLFPEIALDTGPSVTNEERRS